MSGIKTTLQWVLAIVIAVVIIVVLLNMSGVVEFSVGKSYTGEPKEIVAELMRESADEMRSQLPMKPDDVTTLTSVEATGASLTYSSQLDYGSEYVSRADFERQMKAQILKGACDDDWLRLLLSLGGTLRYVHTGSDGSTLGNIAIERADCDSIHKIEDYSSLENFSLNLK